MGRLQWMALASCLASPAMAAEVRCGDGGGVVVGTDAGLVWVAVDDEVHALRPSAGPGEVGSPSDFCTGRSGLVAIVLPAPKPGPDDEVPDEEVELPAFLEDVGGPDGPRLVDEPADAADTADGGEEAAEDEAGRDARQEPAPTLARTRSGALPQDLLDEELAGCQAVPAADGAGLGLFLLGLLGLRRKRGAR